MVSARLCDPSRDATSRRSATTSTAPAATAAAAAGNVDATKDAAGELHSRHTGPSAAATATGEDATTAPSAGGTIL